MARQTTAGARPNRRREAVLFDEHAAGRPLESAGDRTPREMTVRSLVDSTEPGLQAEGFLAPTMRSTLRTAVAMMTASCALLTGCRSATIPNHVPTKPAPVAAMPAAPARTGGLWSY